MNLGVVVRKEQLLQKRRFGDQDDADYQKDDDEEPVIEIKVFFTKSCVLRINLSLKVPNVKFNFVVSFWTLPQPCKQYIEILHWITHLHAIISTRLIFRHYCIRCKCMSTYIELKFDVRYFQG